MDASPYPDDDADGRWQKPLLAALLLAACFYWLEHNWSYAGQGMSSVDREEKLETAIEVTQAHSIMRDGALAALALGGLWLLIYGRGRAWAPHAWLACMFCCFVGWLFVGFALSGDRGYMVRKFIGFFGLLLAGLGCARTMSPRDLVRMAWAAFSAFVAFDVAADIISGGMPLAPDYRFSGTLHPNSQGIYCAIVCMTSVCLARTERNPLLFKAVGGAALVCLILTKSRGSLFALLFALGVMWIAGRERVTRLQAWASAVCLAAVICFGVACIDVGASRQIEEAMLLGRTEDAGSFSGRVPLWDELLKVYFPAHFWTGYGFGGFWTADRIEDLYESQEWAMGNAHNLFLDLLLQTGVVGLTLALATLVCLFAATEACLAQTRDAGYQFFIGMFAFAACNSTMESLFLHPTKFPALLVLTCMFSVMCYGPTEQAGDRTHPAGDGDESPLHRLAALPGMWQGDRGGRPSHG